MPIPYQTAPLSHPRWQLWPGLLFGAGLLLLVVLGMGSLLRQAGGLDIGAILSGSYFQSVVRFTLWQAVLSVALSLAIALPVAAALARYARFPGRSAILRLMELSLVLPTIVAVSGLIGVFGRQGWATGLLNAWLPGNGWNLYGLNGILLAHVFFNAPLAARVLLQAMDAIPAPRMRAASQLGLGGLWLWRSVHWPAVKPVLPGLAALVFTLCFTSFAIIMTLGGGPRTTTLEVAIYQALRFEFDFARAALFAIIQLVICGSLWWLVFRNRLDAAMLPNRRLSYPIPLFARPWHGILASLLLSVFTAFLVAPLLAIVVRGLPALLPMAETPSMYPQLLAATIRSLLIAIPAGLGAVIVALLSIAAANCAGRRWFAIVPAVTGYLPLIVPPLVLGTGLFILLKPGLGNTAQGWVLVALINGLMAVPFALQILRGPMASLNASSLKQADQLGILGWHRWRWLYWPHLRRPIALALAYGVALSLGDFGVIALFGSPGQPTLPVLLYQQLGSYRVAEAAGTGLWLLVVLVFIFATLSRVPDARARARGKVHARQPLPEPEYA
ncbi:thiamine/thiamine pyrophosphate ABC transporter permease ThiP [Marinobacter sp. VGCF2001]|uniref:thiamine/thiamine pyrophosphate ABC transporter permease ThiP n=1 Tax=Marinobacter sp. VGCF2001 TaxID=3417189 RepID=UPI003CF9058A